MPNLQGSQAAGPRSAPAAASDKCSGNLVAAKPAAAAAESSSSGPQPQKQQQQQQPKDSRRQQKKRGGSGAPRGVFVQGPGIGSEIFKRLNFMYQAAHLLACSQVPSTAADNAAAQPPPPSRKQVETTPGQTETARPVPGDAKTANVTTNNGKARQANPVNSNGKKRRRAEGPTARARRRRVIQNQPLLPMARHMASELVLAARKCTVKLDPSVKHSLCRRCSAVLMPGLTAEFKFEPAHPTKRSQRQAAAAEAAPSGPGVAADASAEPENTSMAVDPPEQPFAGETEAGSPALPTTITEEAPPQPPPTARPSWCDLPLAGHSVWTCLMCGYHRKMPVRPGYVPFHRRAAIQPDDPARQG